jgi:hypothetical protein
MQLCATFKGNLFEKDPTKRTKLDGHIRRGKSETSSISKFFEVRVKYSEVTVR